MNDPGPLGHTPYLQAMRALLAKDWRVFRAPMIALALVGAGCYLIAVVEILCTDSANDAANAFFDASIFAFELTALLASAFGGIAIAGERSDRTADFLGLLPVTRGQIILSKWVISAFVVSAFAIFYAGVAVLSSVGQPYGRERAIEAYWALPCAFWAGCVISFFGVAWLLSTFARSGPISACVSIAITIAALVLARSAEPEGAPADTWHWAFRLGLLPSAIGLASLFAGTLYYLRRVAP